MTTLLAPPSPAFRATRLHPAARATTPRTDSGATLEGTIARAWEGLVTSRSVGCPVCGGNMAPRYGASGSAPVGGRCTDCGSTLG
jgi:hypothetical protein